MSWWDPGRGVQNVSTHVPPLIRDMKDTVTADFSQYGRLSYVEMTVNGKTMRRTLNWSGQNLTSISEWTEV